MFKVGDRVEHYGGPSGNGGNAGCYGWKGTVIDLYAYNSDHTIQVLMDNSTVRYPFGSPWSVSCLRLVDESTSYDPTQMGDTDDDI